MTGGLTAFHKGESGEHELALVFGEIGEERAGLEIGGGLVRVKTPGDPCKGVTPRGSRATHRFGESGVDFFFLTHAAETEGLEVAAIFPVELRRDFREDRHTLLSGDIAQSQGDFGTHGGGLVIGHAVGHCEDVMLSKAQGPVGHEPGCGVFGIQQG